MTAFREKAALLAYNRIFRVNVIRVGETERIAQATQLAIIRAQQLASTACEMWGHDRITTEGEKMHVTKCARCGRELTFAPVKLTKEKKRKAKR